MKTLEELKAKLEFARVTGTGESLDAQEVDLVMEMIGRLQEADQHLDMSLQYTSDRGTIYHVRAARKVLKGERR